MSPLASKIALFPGVHGASGYCGWQVGNREQMPGPALGLGA